MVYYGLWLDMVNRGNQAVLAAWLLVFGGFYLLNRIKRRTINKTIGKRIVFRLKTSKRVDILYLI